MPPHRIFPQDGLWVARQTNRARPQQVVGVFLEDGKSVAMVLARMRPVTGRHQNAQGRFVSVPLSFLGVLHGGPYEQHTHHR